MTTGRRSSSVLSACGFRRSSVASGGGGRRPSGAHLELMAVFGGEPEISGPEDQLSTAERSGDLCYPNCDLSVWMRSCDKEQLEPVQGEVQGEIPAWIRGSLLRNGPGRLHAGDDQFQHLFDASALLHRFHISEGRVTYQNRFLRSRTFERNTAARRIVVSEFGTLASVRDPCQTIFQRVSSLFSTDELMTDNAMISIYPYGDALYALTETPYLFRINPDTLATENRVNLMKHTQIVNHTAHPHVMADGTVYNLGQSMSLAGPAYSVVRFPPRQEHEDAEACFRRAELLASVPARWRLHPSYMHSFCITERHFVLIEQPLACSAVAVCRSILQQQPLAAALRWYDEPTRFIVIDRRTGAAVDVTYEAAPLFFLHTINAFERDQHLVVDLCAYPNAEMLDCMYLDALKAAQTNPHYADMFRGRPTRFVIPLNLENPSTSSSNTAGSSASSTDSSRKSSLDSEQCFDNLFQPPDSDSAPHQKQTQTSSAKTPANITNMENNQSAYSEQSSKTSTTSPNLVTLSNTTATAHRLPDGKIRLEPEQLCHLGTETPRINYERCNGREYRYFYAISSDVDGDNPGKLIKVDTETHQALTWCEEHVYPSEPIFIAHPDAQTEDAGVLLSALLWAPGDQQQVGLLVLDARDMRELARSVFTCDAPVPKCLHGWFHADRNNA